MIVLDTNVLSELTRPAPNANVMAWMEAQAAETLFTTAISRGEMLYGAHILPPSRRRDTLLAAVRAIFSEDMAGRVLPYDEAAADAYAEISARRRTVGRPSSQPDLMIAGIARAVEAALATRNTKDFEDCGIGLIDPWQ